VSHTTALFADDCGPDQRHGEVDRWYLFLNSSIRLSECGYLTGKPFAGSSSQIDDPATSRSPFPIHSDLRTAKNKYSRSERSGFAEPAHIAAETLLATHRRTRCALKRFADRSQPTLLGVLSRLGRGGVHEAPIRNYLLTPFWVVLTSQTSVHARFARALSSRLFVRCNRRAPLHAPPRLIPARTRASAANASASRPHPPPPRRVPTGVRAAVCVLRVALAGCDAPGVLLPALSPTDFDDHRHRPLQSVSVAPGAGLGGWFKPR